MLMKKMNITQIDIENGKVQGYLIDLGKAPLLILKADRGYLMCGYLNINAANSLGDIAGRVTSVRTFDDMLNAKVIEISDNSLKIGLHVGVTGREFLNKLLDC